jgi:hypothetical protein
MLFDFATQKWAEIAKISLGFANWSKNGDYVYFLHGENEPSVMRIDIRDWKLEPANGLLEVLALAWPPTIRAFLLRDTGTKEIYALDWQAP